MLVVDGWAARDGRPCRNVACARQSVELIGAAFKRRVGEFTDVRRRLTQEP